MLLFFLLITFGPIFGPFLARKGSASGPRKFSPARPDPARPGPRASPASFHI